MKLKELISLTDSGDATIHIYNGDLGYGKKIISFIGDSSVFGEDILDRTVKRINHIDGGIRIILEEE